MISPSDRNTPFNISLYLLYTQLFLRLEKIIKTVIVYFNYTKLSFFIERSLNVLLEQYRKHD